MARLNKSGCLLLLGLSIALAQDEVSDTDSVSEQDLTLPPTVSSSPGDVRLEPPPEEREDVLEAVVTSGQTEWRLPDLGTSFRDDDEEYDPTERIDVTFLYLFDPENLDPAEEIFPSLEEKLGVGMLQIFEIRIGSRDAE